MIKHIYDSPAEIKSAFAFLINDYGCNIIEESADGLGFIIVYQNAFVKIALTYDYRDNFFSFDIIRGATTQYPNDLDKENIKDFYSIVDAKKIKGIAKSDLQPTASDYLKPLALNANLLKQYGAGILKGSEWPG